MDGGETSRIMIQNPPVVKWRKAQVPLQNERPPLLVLLHGRGADESDLFELSPAIDPAFAIASVRGPLVTDEGGYTWSESRGVGRAEPASLRASIEWLHAWLDSLGGGRREPQRICLVGFSAGMAMAAALLFDRPSRFSGAVLLSGTLPFDAGLPISENRLANLEIFYGHGSFDRVIPADLVTRTSAYLRDHSGANVTARRYPIAHEISAPETADLASWLDRLRTGAQKPAVGFEPTTLRLQNESSTPELHRHDD